MVNTEEEPSMRQTLCLHVTDTCLQVYESGTADSPILQMKKMRHREKKSLPKVAETAEGPGVKGTGAELFGDGEHREEGVLSGEAGGIVPAGRRQRAGEGSHTRATSPRP